MKTTMSVLAAVSFSQEFPAPRPPLHDHPPSRAVSEDGQSHPCTSTAGTVFGDLAVFTANPSLSNLVNVSSLKPVKNAAECFVDEPLKWNSISVHKEKLMATSERCGSANMENFGKNTSPKQWLQKGAEAMRIFPAVDFKKMWRPSPRSKNLSEEAGRLAEVKKERARPGAAVEGC